MGSREREGRLRYNQSGHRWSHFTLEGCRMSKGGHGAAAANVLLLKKSEETRRQENLREAIKRVDSNGEVLSPEEYQKILNDNNISSSKAEIVSMLESSQEKEKSHQQHKAEMAFRLMDRNNDGYVTKQEMLNTTKKLTQKQIEAVFARNDKDGDGKLSKEEFKDMMCKEKK